MRDFATTGRNAMTHPNKGNTAAADYWKRVRAGEVEHKTAPRGKDKVPRATPLRMEIAARLKDAYGFDIHEEIVKNKLANDEIMKLGQQAKSEGDTDLLFQCLNSFSTQQNKFISTMLPYVEGKKASRTPEEQKETISIDDLYTQSLEDKSDED